jgi:hypothetical protein
MMTLDDVATFCKALAGVVVGARWNMRTWLVGEHGFAWQRPLSKADLGRYADAGETPPTGDILAVATENLDAKDALLAMDLPGFFTIPHFNGYAAVLIELRLAHKRDVKSAITAAHAVAAARPPKKKAKAKPRPKTPAATRRR